MLGGNGAGLVRGVSYVTGKCGVLLFLNEPGPSSLPLSFPLFHRSPFFAHTLSYYSPARYDSPPRVVMEGSVMASPTKNWKMEFSKLKSPTRAFTVRRRDAEARDGDGEERDTGEK